MNLGFDCTLFPAVSGVDNFSPFVCQICNRFYHRPLLLPCNHSYCEKCVYDAAFRNYNIFVCHQCKTICDVTRDHLKYNRDLTNAVRLVGPINTSHLWVDFKIRCLCHGDTLKEASSNPNLLKKWLCVPCCRLVCLKCTNSGGAHATHKVVPAISRVDFDTLYMETLKASFAYNVVQQTSNELFWLLEDLKVAIVKLQDYCESYNTYIDEHVSLTQGCLATVAVALKKQVWQQAADKRRRLHKYTRLAAELMAEARRRETHGNILLEPLDPVRSAKAYNEAQKWLLYWVASPPARINLPKETSLPDPIGTRRPSSVDDERKVKHNRLATQPEKSSSEAAVDSQVPKQQKRVSPIGSNRPSFRTISGVQESEDSARKKPVVSDSRELLTGIKLPLHQSIKPPEPLVVLANEQVEYSRKAPLVSNWPVSKVEFDKNGNLLNQQDRMRGDGNHEVLVDVQVPLQSTPLSPIGANRPNMRMQAVIEEREESTNKSSTEEKREVLVGIKLPIHQNFPHLTNVNAATETATLLADSLAENKRILRGFSHTKKTPTTGKPTDTMIKRHDKICLGNDITVQRKRKREISPSFSVCSSLTDTDQDEGLNTRVQADEGGVGGGFQIQSSSQSDSLSIKTSICVVTETNIELERENVDEQTVCSVELISNKFADPRCVNEYEKQSTIESVTENTKEGNKTKLHRNDVKVSFIDECKLNQFDKCFRQADKLNSTIENGSDNTDSGNEITDDSGKAETSIVVANTDQQLGKKNTATNVIEDESFLSEKMGAHGYTPSYHTFEEDQSTSQNRIQYSRAELMKLADHASNCPNVFSQEHEWDKRVKKSKKIKPVDCSEKLAHPSLRTDDTAKKYPNISKHGSEGSTEYRGLENFLVEDKDSDVDAERILEGLECSFVRMAWDTVESILLELRFVHSDVNWAELWHLLVSAARPDAEFRLHPSDGAHCVTTRAVHLLHIAPLFNPRVIWANWDGAHPCQYHQDRWSKRNGTQGSSGNVGIGLMSLFQHPERTAFPKCSSQDKSGITGKISASKLHNEMGNLLGNALLTPTQGKEVDDTTVVHGSAHRHASAGKRSVRTWAELVSGPPREHCCQQSDNEHAIMQNHTHPYLPSISQAVRAIDPSHGPCGSTYMSKSIVDELLHELTTPVFEYKPEHSTYGPTELQSDGHPVTPEQYRMYCLLNNRTVDLGPCTNPNCPKFRIPFADYSHNCKLMNPGTSRCTSLNPSALSKQKIRNGTVFNLNLWPNSRMQPSETQFDTTIGLSEDTVNKNGDVLSKYASVSEQRHESCEKVEYPAGENGSVDHRCDSLRSTLMKTSPENESEINDHYCDKNDTLRCTSGSDNKNGNYFDKRCGNASVSQKSCFYTQEDKRESKSKNSLTLADWITLGDLNIHKPIATGGRYHSREYVPLPENEPKRSSLPETTPKGTTRLPAIRKGRSQEIKGLGDDNKPRSRGSSVDQAERTSQTRMSKAKIRKEQRKLRQSQKKPWSTAGRKSCELPKDETDCNKELGEKDEVCTEDSPDDKSPEDSEDADLSIDSQVLEQCRHSKGEEQEGSGQDTDEEWLAGLQMKPRQGEGDATKAPTPDEQLLKKVNENGNLGKTTVGDNSGPQMSSASSTASVTPEMLEFFRNRRKGRLGSSKATRTDHRRVHKERQVKKPSNSSGKKGVI